MIFIPPSETATINLSNKFIPFNYINMSKGNWINVPG